MKKTNKEPSGSSPMIYIIGILIGAAAAVIYYFFIQ